MGATFTGPGGGWNEKQNDADTKSGPNGTAAASATVKGKAPAGFDGMTTDNDGDGDDFMNSGNGAGGSAGTPEGHERFVPGG